MIEDRTLQRLDVAVVVGRDVDDDGGVPDSLHAAATRVLIAGELDLALRAIEETQPQLVLLRESVSLADALAFVSRAKGVSAQSVIVVLAPKPCVEHAVRLINAGASDYVQGPLDNRRLRELLVKLKTELARAGQGGRRFFCDHCPPGVSIVGRSDGMTQTLETVRMVAESRCNPVLILGETGTGKELAARAVHAWRGGDDAPFVAVNCAALTANLLESELFGHARGAFTGADREKVGLFELAGAGTIFLDEISEMALELQAKLLRVLQERTFRKVGGTKDITCQATVVASSNRSLLADAHAGRFRKDLYYRLAVFPITMPALRDDARRSDVPLLAEFFLRNSEVSSGRTVRGLDRYAREKLMSHHWPGNVRELRNVIDRAIILERGERISAANILIDLHAAEPVEPTAPPAATQAAPQPAAAGPSAAPQPQPDAKPFSLETAEREFIVRALKETGWQRTRAAALLGITRATLHTKLKRYDIKSPGSSSKAATGGERRMAEAIAS